MKIGKTNVDIARMRKMKSNVLFYIENENASKILIHDGLKEKPGDDVLEHFNRDKLFIKEKHIQLFKRHKNNSFGIHKID